jgi:hypothetical protein
MHEGLGPHPTFPSCDTCGADGASYRCLDCYSGGLSCKTCTIHQHAHHPFHTIQVTNHYSVSSVAEIFLQQWNGEFFARKTLADLGMLYQLGHSAGGTCSHPSSSVDLTLFDITGVQTLRVRYCFCNNGGLRPPANRRVQLLRARLFPASWSRPGTVFTFRLLDFTHKLQTRCKVNLYDFHATLISVTNSTGLAPSVVRLITYVLHPSTKMLFW